jgi:metallophosphoesterase superfamily enzyme
MINCVVVNSDWLLTPQRAAIHLPTGTGVVADLHLGYDLTRMRGGDATPAISIEEQLDPLRQALAEHAVHRLVVAGDLVESARCDSLMPAFRAWLRANNVEWFRLSAGNHDEGLPKEGQGGHRRGLKLGEWVVVHGDAPLPSGQVIHGHLHPFFRWTDHAAGSCYLVSARRMILPAYSADSAGLNVVGKYRWKNYQCCVTAGARVLDMGRIGDIAVRKMGRPGKPRAMRYSPGRRQRG